MTTDELVSLIAADLRLPKTTIRRLLTELAKAAISETKKNGAFLLPGLGKLLLAQRRARTGRNPQVGEPIKIPARKIVRFRVDKGFQDQMQGRFIETMKFAGDEAVEIASYVSERPSASEQPPRGQTADFWIIKIFYATDRQPTSQDPLRFGSRRSSPEQLHVGTCEVSIPRDHRMAKIERPTIWRLYRENPKKHFVIREITAKDDDSFFSELAQCVKGSKKNDAFVFIHGFKVAFNDAVYRTAQIAHDLGFLGAPILYSWPSNGELYEYPGDINNTDWTVDHLRTFLEQLASRSGAQVIHLIAHSMGNRALANALSLLDSVGPTSPPRFNEIILTAPDVDAGTFKHLAAAIQANGKRVTLYCSKRDRALMASKRINGSYPRAGDCSSTVVVIPGIDTIDASAVDTNLIGHFYYAENRSVLSDIFNLLKYGEPADGRFGILSDDVPPPTHWKFAP
ncbi:MAG TPA: alpha/beta hydrolase [Candidatus Eremiobacteraceae bacterium]|nr:alpha/beta hydrolase [Candidatus Eremiobacteraceae bacterium]